MSRRPKILGGQDIFCLKKSGFAKEASFDPKTAIFCHELKTAWNKLTFFILIKLGSM